MLLEDAAETITAAKRPIIVQKYGGSSVADVERLGRVADRIVATRRAGCGVVAVVSAMGKSTDGLLELAREVAASGSVAGAQPPRRELDMLVSTGERVAMSLLSIAIQARGFDAISFTGSQCGIITNHRHFDARIIEVRPHRIEDELAQGRIVIVAGYQGMSQQREITTLGRGGTDTTAVALAAALEAQQCEIYSDVDGVYSADPRAVADASHLPEIDYDMVHEMAHAGAKVLCAQAIDWARRAGVAVFARSTFDPIGGTPRQTIVRKFGPSEQQRARAVACDRNIAWLCFGANKQQAAWLALLAEQGVSASQLRSGEGGHSLLVSLANVPDWDNAQRALRAFDDKLVLRQDVARISVVGSQLTDDPKALVNLREALLKANAAPLDIDASPLRFSVLVEELYADAAQQALHETFVRK